MIPYRIITWKSELNLIPFSHFVKIVDIQLRGVTDVRAKLAWYRSSTQSCITLSDLHPFEEYFDVSK